MCVCVCVAKVWSLPAISKEVQSLTCKVSLQLPSLGPSCCCKSCLGPGQVRGETAVSWAALSLLGFWHEGKPCILLFGTGLKTSHLLPFPCCRSLIKQAPTEAAGISPGLPFPSLLSCGTGDPHPVLWPLCTVWADRLGALLHKSACSSRSGVRLPYPTSSSGLPWSISWGFAFPGVLSVAQVSARRRLPGVFGRPS